MKLGETILKYRQQRGLSQEKLAERVGVSRQAVSKWEVGDAIPDTDKLIPLARALGITVDELLGNVPEEEEAQSPSDPSLAGEYTCVGEDAKTVTEPEKKPGWFATHWYWLGLIPAVWGAWRLIQLIIVLVSALLFAVPNIGVGGAYEIEVDSFAQAEEIIIDDGGEDFDRVFKIE